MTHEHEFLVFLVAVVIRVFVQSVNQELKDLPDWRLFSTAFDVLVVSMLLTTLEAYFWSYTLNLLEHVCYAGASLLLAVWSWRVFVRGENSGIRRGP